MLPGLVIQSEPKRLYPAGKAVAHLVGYVSEVTESDLTANRFPGRRAGLDRGQGGPRAGVRRHAPWRGGRALHRGERARPPGARGGEHAALPPTPGKPISTTIDLDLQRYIDSIWPAGRPRRHGRDDARRARSARSTRRRPTTPTRSWAGSPRPSGAALNDDEARPLLNRAIQTRYPPASPFKLAIAAMALKRGLIGLDTHMPTPCRGGLRLGNRVFRCWKKEGHGSLDLVGAVAASCDVYFYQLGLRLGLNAIVQDGVLMGFRDKSGIDLENEVDPIYPATTAYFDRLYGPRRWSPPATTLNFSIGQGENTQTLINMMRFYEGLLGRRERGARRSSCGPRRRPPRVARLCRRRSWTGSGGRSSPWSSAAPRRPAATPTWPSPARPAPRRTRTARTTAGSSASPRRRSRSSWSAGSWSSPSTGRRWRPYVVRDAPALHPRAGHGGHDQGEGPAGRSGRARRTPRPGRSSSIPTRPRPGPQEDSVRRAGERAMRTATLDRRLLVGEPRPDDVRPAHALLGRADRRPDARRRRVAPPVRLVRHRHRGRVGRVPHLAPAARVARAGAVRVQHRAARRGAGGRHGAGTAQSSHSWLSIGGHQIGQPSELAKVATVLMLARYLSGPEGAAALVPRPADARA